MAVLFKPDSDTCPHCRKSWIDHDGVRTLCNKVQRSIHRLILIQKLAEENYTTVKPTDMKAIAEICGIVVKELES